ncbi:type I restriction-modification system subunit M [Candidatus Pelagibacter sp.]|nr:type I restriction-modification system subunit M [Candidatus Pelagibacter sp.]
MKVTQSQLEQYLSKAAWILKGPVDASDFKSYIFPLLFFKRISDVYDEEYELALKESGNDKEYASLKEFHRFIIPKNCHWKDIRETSTNVGSKIQTAIREIESANQEYLSGIFGDVQWSNKEKLSDELLNNLIDHFSQYNLSNSSVSPDILGDAYEYLIKHFADLTNKKAGEFYTPRSVVNLMVKILDPKENESIYDPACGTGGMLIESLDYLKKSNLNSKTLKIFGQESNLTTSAIARINLFLHNAEDFKIFKGDTLRNPGFFDTDHLKIFDCVIANPPFSLDDWGSEIWVKDLFGRNFAGIPPKSNGDMAWVQHMIKSMNTEGRMAVVLPNGVLYRKGSEQKIRKSILDKDLLETVIGLGHNIFYGTQISPCILIFKKKKEEFKKNKVLFIDASDQIKVGRAQNYLEEENIKKIFTIYNDYKNLENISKISSKKDIEKNNYSLNIPLYVEKNIVFNLPRIGEALAHLKKSWSENIVSEKKFRNFLNNFSK